MINFDVTLDAESRSRLDRMSTSPMWDTAFFNKLPEELAKSAEEHMKPLFVARSYSTGQLAANLRHEVTRTGNGFDITFHDFRYGLWVDTGNFDPGTVLQAPVGNVQSAFPIDSRFSPSPAIFSPYIHGMGSITPESPTHYSEKTLEYMANGEATWAALSALYDYLETVVS